MGAEKLVKDDILYVVLLLANTAILTIWIFSRKYHLQLGVFTSTGEYFCY